MELKLVEVDRLYDDYHEFYSPSQTANTNEVLEVIFGCCEWYLKVRAISVELSLKGESKKIISFNLGELLKRIENDILNEYRFNLESKPFNILKSTLFCESNTSLEPLIYDIYIRNSSEYYEAYKEIEDVIKSRSTWFRIFNKDHNFEISKYSKSDLFDDYRNLLNRVAENLGVKQDVNHIKLEKLRGDLIEYFELPIQSERFNKDEIGEFAKVILGHKESRERCKKIINYLEKKPQRQYFLNLLHFLNSQNGGPISKAKEDFIKNLQSVFDGTPGYSSGSLRKYFMENRQNNSISQDKRIDLKRHRVRLESKVVLNYIEGITII